MVFGAFINPWLKQWLWENLSMQNKCFYCLKLHSHGTWKGKSRFQELPFWVCTDFRGNKLQFLQIWVSRLRKQERKITTRAIPWHDAMSSGQIDQFNFASHVLKCSNIGWLLPDSDVHSTAVYHPMKYPRAAFAQFLHNFPFPHSRAWGDTAPDRPSLPLMEDNKPFFFS